MRAATTSLDPPKHECRYSQFLKQTVAAGLPESVWKRPLKPTPCLGPFCSRRRSSVRPYTRLPVPISTSSSPTARYGYIPRQGHLAPSVLRSRRVQPCHTCFIPVSKQLHVVLYSANPRLAFALSFGSVIQFLRSLPWYWLCGLLDF